MGKTITTSAGVSDVIYEIEHWRGEINTPLGSFLRTKTYECFNGFIYNLGKDIDAILGSKEPEAIKLQSIRSVLLHYNIAPNSK